jgi:copper chaperone CopZ
MTPETTTSSESPSPDQFVVIRIEGLHCHKCEQTIKKHLQKVPGVNEAEVDFASGQASVLYNPQLITIPQLISKIRETGYNPTGFTESQPDSVG